MLSCYQLANVSAMSAPPCFGGARQQAGLKPGSTDMGLMAQDLVLVSNLIRAASDRRICAAAPVQWETLC